MKGKGIFKGFKYISHIFEEEEEEKIEIGLPTDVKHVAHIGWDGPAVSSPSWMNDFKSSPPSESASAPTQVDGIANGLPDDVDRVSQDSKTSKKSAKDSQSRDVSNLPKSSRRQSSNDSIGSLDSPHESPTRKSSRTNRRRHSKHKESSSPKSGESSNNPPNVPKKTRRKKSKDIDGGSVKSKSKENGPRHESKPGSDDDGR